MPRRVWLVPAVLLFLACSFELARFLSASGNERGAIFALLKDQARGDAPAMLARLEGCAEDRACVALVASNAARLTASGPPKILLLESHSAYSLTDTVAQSRVAWSDVKDHGPTFVQCVKVRKSWSFVDGSTVHLQRIGPRIGNEASCPR